LPGGADGSVQHLANVGGNRGLDSFAPQFVEAAKKEGVSDADIIQLAGIVSIKHCGGPNIPFIGGRRDNKNPNPIVVDRLPGRKEKYEAIKAKFISQGITPEEMVALGAFVFEAFR
jgi:L-ascorbate peroxidase